MDDTLEILAGTLDSNLKLLKGVLHSDLLESLHDGDLPLKRTSELAARVVDLLTEVRLLLEPASVILADHFLGYTDSKCLTAVVELGVIDILASGPKSASEIASSCNASPTRLCQVLRVLRNNGIFAYDADSDLYSINHVSRLLLKSHWTQWHRWVSLYGTEFYDIASGIPAFLHANCSRTPAQMNYNTDDSILTYFDRSGLGTRVHETLSAGAVAQAPGIIEDYPWNMLSSILDVGGGTGGLVASLLRRYPTLGAGILDTKTVIDQARLNFAHPGGEYSDVGDRARFFVGDFFQSVPPYENYVIKWCLHNWDDQNAARILRTIRRSIIQSPGSHLIVLEGIVKEGHSGRISLYADMNMMMTIGGCERSENSWRRLIESSGWKVSKMHPLRNSWSSAIELVPATMSEESHQKHSVNGFPGFDRDAGVDIEGLAKGQLLVSGRRCQTTMSFLEPWDNIAKSGEPFFRSQPDEGLERTNFEWVEHSVEVEDVRPKMHSFNINAHSFAFVDDSDGLNDETLSALRSNSTELIEELYYPSVKSLISRVTGSRQVIIFDHTVRKRDPTLAKGSNPDGHEQPATIVHCDQSAKGAIGRLGQNLPPGEDIAAVLKKRVQLINVWRPLQETVLEWPLAVMDFESLQRSEIHPCDLLRGRDEFRGQTVTFCHERSQKWYYLDKQAMDEVLLIKIWDNKPGVAERMSQ